MKSRSRHVKPTDAGGLLDKQGNIIASYEPDFENCVLPYCTWYQDDFLGAVRGMKAAEIGIYSVLLNEMYERGTAISLPPERLARLCGTTKKTLENTLEILIEDGRILRLDCGLWNARVQKIFIQREKNAASNSQAGKISAEKRNEINGGDERALNGGSTSVEPIPETQIEDIDGGGDSAGARDHFDQPDSAEPPPEIHTFRERILEAIGVDPISGLTVAGRTLGSQIDMAWVEKWKADLALSDDEIVDVIREVMARKFDGPPSSFKYFNEPMQRRAGAKQQPTLKPIEGSTHDREFDNSRTHRTLSPSGRAHQDLSAAFARPLPGQQ